MARKKLERFAAFASFPNSFEFTKDLAGRWRSEYFGNDNPLVLELGCGKGEYTVALGKRNKHINYIGIDIQGERLWYGASAALETTLSNVAFLRAYIDHVHEYFSPGEVDEMWITFPDPYPRASTIKKRLTAPNFLARYQKILKPEGKLHLKTDNLALFEYSLQSITDFEGTIQKEQRDIVLDTLSDEDVLRVQTTFEKKYRARGVPIHYCCFCLPLEKIS